MTDTLNTRFLDAGIASMKNFAANNREAARSMGPSIFNYALLPMIGQYLSLAPNNGLNPTILPEFQTFFDEFGKDLFTLHLLRTLNRAPVQISQRFENAREVLEGPLVALIFKAYTFELKPEEGEAGEQPRTESYIDVTLCGEHISSSCGNIRPLPSEEQSFFPRSFCAALAVTAIASGWDLPSYVKFQGDIKAWRQCLSDSMAESIPMSHKFEISSPGEPYRDRFFHYPASWLQRVCW
jgi:hypothetical protein